VNDNDRQNCLKMTLPFINRFPSGTRNIMTFNAVDLSDPKNTETTSGPKDNDISKGTQAQ